MLGGCSKASSSSFNELATAQRSPTATIALILLSESEPACANPAPLVSVGGVETDSSFRTVGVALGDEKKRGIITVYIAPLAAVRRVVLGGNQSCAAGGHIPLPGGGAPINDYGGIA